MRTVDNPCPSLKDDKKPSRVSAMYGRSTDDDHVTDYLLSGRYGDSFDHDHG